MTGTDRQQLAYLDLARGVAALLVLGGHLRFFVFDQINRGGQAGPGWYAFYELTALGHPAVMLFFVISGYLISGGVLERIQAGSWSWRNYALRRLSRLWLVLVPAVALTFLWDLLGMQLGSSYYDGGLDSVYEAGITPSHAASYAATTVIANLLFLQTIVAPTIGSNGPLWSLANEFWYYVLFPLIAVAASSRFPRIHRIGCAGLALILCGLLPRDLVLYGLIWLMGVGARVLAPRLAGHVNAARAMACAALLALGAVLASTQLHMFEGKASDFVIGAACAVLLVGAVNLQPKWVALRSVSRTLASFSYTLYATHFPLVVFLGWTVLHGERLAHGLPAVVIYLGGMAVLLGYAYALSLVTERQTSRLQAWLIGYLDTPTPAATMSTRAPTD